MHKKIFFCWSGVEARKKFSVTGPEWKHEKIFLSRVRDEHTKKIFCPRSEMSTQKFFSV